MHTHNPKAFYRNFGFIEGSLTAVILYLQSYILSCCTCYIYIKNIPSLTILVYYIILCLSPSPLPHTCILVASCVVHMQNGKGALWYAAANGHLPILRLLAGKYGCSPRVDERSDVCCACSSLKCIIMLSMSNELFTGYQLDKQQ